ncbi:MAG: PP2C family protein-serine/threonine phosphatase [Panacagrimonas sp.]
MEPETIDPIRLICGEWSLSGATHRGKIRLQNEDAFRIEPDIGLAVVSDGVGGLESGAVASRLVTKFVTEHVRRNPGLNAAIEQAHLDLIKHFRSDRRAGATVVVAAFGDRQVEIAWAGDSRAYLWRKDQLSPLTRDHSLVESMVRQGLITPEQAAKHPQRNVILSALGVRNPNHEDLEISTVTLDTEPGDLILLSTDGLHGYLTEEAMLRELRQSSDEQDAVRRLMESTLRDTAAGDNLTVVCARRAD